ncbi:MAG: 8-amino-7-oxononanoate synthase [uncultured Nocardioidaceae bacterium]|uniref:8-amino-7-oxononanoate synthase n=1 Tax=uncultured Nocardioidaceae bacterium TaxID=253824 RepID=A0A6J4N468_9ACTN|nr:MAG: 8-amino-7-oxononanoate synthase [uncultured Nocardioidaceae bacterium]
MSQFPTQSKMRSWLLAAAARRDEQHLTRRLVPRTPEAATLDLAGNDYLGLSRHPDVVEGAIAAARDWGAGAGASRLVSGTLPLHARLEETLAAWCRRPAALVTSSGYAANLAAVTALADADTLIVSDAHVHASLVDGCRLARGSVRIVPHLDVAAAEEALAARSQPRALVLVESVWSVLGDVSDLAALLAVCERHDAMLLVDEAHGLGTTGDAGRGLSAALQPADPTRMVVTATLSKALGSQGGAVLGDPLVLQHLVNTARPFIFDTALAPAPAGAALAALQVLAAGPERVQRLHRVAGSLATAVGAPSPAAAVLAVPMPSPQAALDASAQLAADGVRVGCFRPPSVPDGVSRLRLTASAALSDDQVSDACSALRRVLDATRTAARP